MITNTHVHTPYSFSTFESIEQTVTEASRQSVKALGINDCNTVAGFKEFAASCTSHKIYPIFNIELIALSTQDQNREHRWNDLVKPGIIHISGKALNNPVIFSNDTRNLIASIWKTTQDRIWRIIEALNAYTASRDLPLTLDYNIIRSAYAKSSLLERHLSYALYKRIEERWPSPHERIDAYRQLFDNNEFTADLDDTFIMQHEIHKQLFLAGKPAYVTDTDAVFISLAQAKQIILQAGGIPCYHIQIDERFPFTEYERNPEELAKALSNKGLHAVEFTPYNTSPQTLERYVQHFHQQDFCITFGTEHNTPFVRKLVPSTNNSKPLTEALRNIGYEGACMLAAHQQLHLQNRRGFVDESGKQLVTKNNRAEFVSIGDAVIRTQIANQG